VLLPAKLSLGYDSQIPRTTAGRLLSLPYVVIGIPLTFCFLSRAGRDLARCFLTMYRQVCCDVLCCKRCLRRRRQRIYSQGGRRAGYYRSPDGASYVATNSVGQYLNNSCLTIIIQYMYMCNTTKQLSVTVSFSAEFMVVVVVC